MSSKAVGHSLVTQGELLISREWDVLASASGSFEDKQRVDGVVVGSATERSSESFKGGHAEVSPLSFSLSLALGACPRSSWFTLRAGVVHFSPC